MQIQQQTLAIARIPNGVLWRFPSYSPLFYLFVPLLLPYSLAVYSASSSFKQRLASNPPYYPTYDGVISVAMGRFLPAVFIALFIYRYVIRYTLRNLTARVEKTVLWLGSYWVGVIGNHTFDKIPISQLTPHDLQQGPGAITALIAITLTVSILALAQVWAFQIEGSLPRYLSIYTIHGACVVLLLAIPRLHLRIHHNILALLLLPGTTLQTRPSLLYQGFLVGLFINGIARWGFDSILQTDAALRTDEQFSSLLPTIPLPNIAGNNITFSFSPDEGYDGISVLVNDVERFLALNQPSPTFMWSKVEGDSAEYFRFGFVKYGRPIGLSRRDYTKAGIWTADGHWAQMHSAAIVQKFECFSKLIELAASVVIN